MSNSFLKLCEVRRRTAKSRSEIYRGINRGTFPAQVKTGARSCVWVESEIEKWLSDRIAERDSKRGAL